MLKFMLFHIMLMCKKSHLMYKLYKLNKKLYISCNVLIKPLRSL